MSAALQIAQAAYPHQRVRLFIQDEGRVGLKPILRRVWAKMGHRPVIEQHRGYQWVYVYVFVEPATGQSEFLILPTVSIRAMQLALEEFNRAVNPTGQDVIVLLLDQAGWHTSPRLKVPNNVLLLNFPAYTPELSPLRLWWGR